jgi:hypothetical protein
VNTFNAFTAWKKTAFFNVMLTKIYTETIYPWEQEITVGVFATWKKMTKFNKHKKSNFEKIQTLA